MAKNKWKAILPMFVLMLGICSNVKADTVTERIWGKDRYDTAIEVSKNGWKDGSEYVVLANGQDFPDALAAKNSSAIILLDEVSGGATREYIRKVTENVSKINVLGGTGSITNKLLREAISSNKKKIDMNELMSTSPYWIEDGNWNYYRGEWGKITKIKLDGSGKVILSNNAPTDIILKDNWIYYYKEDGIYKVTTDGKKETKIKAVDDCSEINDMKVIGDKICFILSTRDVNKDGYPNYKLITIDLNGENERVLSENSLGWMGNISYNKDSSSDYIYYINNSQLTRCDLKIGTKTKLSDKSICDVSVYKGYIFFSVLPDTNDSKTFQLYRMKADGTEETHMGNLTTFMNLNDNKFTISNDWVYYCDYEHVIWKFKFNSNEKIKLRAMNEENSAYKYAAPAWPKVRGNYLYFSVVFEDGKCTQNYKMSLYGKTLINLNLQKDD